MPQKLQGIGIGNGIVVSKVNLLSEVVFTYEDKSKKDKKEEQLRLTNTLTDGAKQLSALADVSATAISEEKADIFRAHVAMMQDEALFEEMSTLITEGYTAEHAIDKVFESHAVAFSQMEDKYFQERSSDLKDIKKRLLSIVLKVELPDLLLIKEECVIVANDLTPSETVLLNPKFIKGFITDIGGATSHSAIMAKTLGIPAIVSAKNATQLIKNGEFVAFDATKGTVEFQLSDGDIKSWETAKKQYAQILKELETYKTGPAITLDDVEIQILGNIGHPKDINKVLENGGTGVGLFRSEFLYMDSSSWPTVDQQHDAYKAVLDAVEDFSPVTIRTLDIGGDKHLDYYTFPKELNPFLGYRALRMSLKEPDIFKVQLKALLSASIFGNLKIMFPMVATYDEFVQAKKITLEVAEECKKEGIIVDEKMQIGMMIEIPSSALMADQFAEVADFFSIGSNDLIQYTHAADRMSEEVSYLYQPNSPSILKLIEMTANAANKKGISVSVCGEMASLPRSIPILLGLGIKTLSMSSNSIPIIKRIINNVSLKDCQALAKKALVVRNEAEVDKLVEQFFNKNNLII